MGISVVVKEIRFSLLLAVLLALPGPLGAQAGPDPFFQNSVSATGSVSLKAGKVAQEGRLHLGGWAGLVFGDNWAVGGGGFALLNDVELASSEGETGFSLGMGYGGLFFRYWEPISSSLTGEVGLLVGGGHAEVQNILIGSEVGSDNFFVVEPEMSLFYSILSEIHAGVSLGYRLASGVEDLPRVLSGDLSAFTATLTLRLGGR